MDESPSVLGGLRRAYEELRALVCADGSHTCDACVTQARRIRSSAGENLLRDGPRGSAEGLVRGESGNIQEVIYYLGRRRWVRLQGRTGLLRPQPCVETMCR